MICWPFQSGCSWARIAAAPATCGVAIDVPEMVLVAVSLVFQPAVMEEPGAKMSRAEP